MYKHKTKYILLLQTDPHQSPQYIQPISVEFWTTARFSSAEKWANPLSLPQDLEVDLGRMIQISGIPVVEKPVRNIISINVRISIIHHILKQPTCFNGIWNSCSASGVSSLLRFPITFLLSSPLTPSAPAVTITLWVHFLAVKLTLNLRSPQLIPIYPLVFGQNSHEIHHCSLASGFLYFYVQTYEVPADPWMRAQAVHFLNQS